MDTRPPPNGHSCVSRCRRLGKVSTNNTAAKIVTRLLETDEGRWMLCCGSSGTVNAFLAAWSICRHGCAPAPPNIPVGTTGVFWPLETRFGVLTFNVGPSSVTSRRWRESLRYETKPSQLRWAHRPKLPTPQAVAGLADSSKPLPLRTCAVFTSLHVSVMRTLFAKCTEGTDNLERKGASINLASHFDQPSKPH